MRTVREIQDDLRDERRELGEATVALRREIHRSLDVRTRLRRHPFANIAVVLSAILVVAFIVSIPILGAATIGRAVRGVWERIS
jgi:hypothetical protein